MDRFENIPGDLDILDGHSCQVGHGGLIRCSSN